MSNDILSPDYSQLLRVFVSGTKMLMRAWLEQLQPSALCNCCFPSVVIVLMTHRLFCCKVNQGVIPWVWVPLVLVGTRKSPSAVNPLCSIKTMVPLSSDPCEQVDQIFRLQFYTGDLYDITLSNPHLPDSQPKQHYSKRRLSYAHNERPFELVQSFVLCLPFLSESAPFVSIKPGTWDKAATCASITCA